MRVFILGTCLINGHTDDEAFIHFRLAAKPDHTMATLRISLSVSLSIAMEGSVRKYSTAHQRNRTEIGFIL